MDALTIRDVRIHVSTHASRLELAVLALFEAYIAVEGAVWLVVGSKSVMIESVVHNVNELRPILSSYVVTTSTNVQPNDLAPFHHRKVLGRASPF